MIYVFKLCIQVEIYVSRTISIVVPQYPNNIIGIKYEKLNVAYLGIMV